MGPRPPPDKVNRIDNRRFKPNLDGAFARPHIKAVMIAETIETKLTRALDPVDLEIVDESHLHAGHAGARPEGETHFRVKVVSRAFDGKSRIDRQRMVFEALSDEMTTRIHALTLKTLTPDEDKKI